MRAASRARRGRPVADVATLLDPAVLALAGTVLASSLFGSAHCAGMCGGLALVAIGTEGRSRALRQAGYHGGRLVSYGVLGAVAGLVGQVVDDAGTLVGVQRVAAVVGGLAIAFFGVVAIVRAFGMPLRGAGVPRWMVALAQRVHTHALRFPQAWRGVPIGLASPLLPCGWLYAFAAIAAASAAPAAGARVMAAFWLGTVPAVLVASNGARVVLSRFGRAAPLAAGVAMLVVGVHAAFSRSSMAERALADVRALRVSAPVSAEALSAQCGETADELPPCCRSVP